MFRFLLSIIFAALLAAFTGRASASFVYTYDFPGTPAGSGLAVDQTNPQPGNATFSDFTRTGVTQLPTANAFDSDAWSHLSGNTPDPATYVSFSITASAGYHLDLSLLTFDEVRGPGGPTKGEVDLYLNGSATPYATMPYNPTATLQGQTFNFTPTTDAQNVTSAQFVFYCWNAGTTSPFSMLFDNVSTTLNIVPEPGTWFTAAIPLALVAWSTAKWRSKARGTRPVN